MKQHKWFVDYLKTITPVVLVNEFRTSKICSTCHASTMKKPNEEEKAEFPKHLRKTVKRRMAGAC